MAQQPLIMDAVCRNISIMGEAARKTDAQFREAHPEIPWSGLVGARNIVTHAYEFLKAELIREMAEVHTPALLKSCLQILGEKAE